MSSVAAQPNWSDRAGRIAHISKYRMGNRYIQSTSKAGPISDCHGPEKCELSMALGRVLVLKVLGHVVTHCGYCESDYLRKDAAMTSAKHKSPLPPYTTPAPQRSRNMAAIRSRDTKPELFVQRALHANGFRFRLHRRDLPGNPDIVLPRFRTAVMVHGCFWHGHGCPAKHVPKSNSPYWSSKIARNMARDARNTASLEMAGWRVMTVWECTLTEDTQQLIDGLKGLIFSNESTTNSTL